MIDAVSKAFFHGLAGSAVLKRSASRYGMRTPGSFARRFIAGETIDEALAAARQVEAQGLTQTLDYLGEAVANREAAAAATAAYLDVVDRVMQAGIGRNLSIKLTQLGLAIDRAITKDNLKRILDAATPAGFFVRIDMENSPYTDATLDLFEEVWREGYHEVGVVLQSALHRSEQDLQRMNRLGARVRLVKGAYKEPADIAYQSKADVDAAFLRMMRALLIEGAYPAIASHDPSMIEDARAFVRERAIAPDRFEFQMLYGIRRDLQTALAADGYRMRVYIPFGREWFPYFMRRLGERPANVLFVLNSLMKER
jgi:proline dehydrogenase